MVQVNGKTRSKVTVPRDADEDTVSEAARADTTTRPIRKVIFVPNRLINFVL